MRLIKPSRPNVYTGGTLNRAAHRREDAAWILAAQADAAARYVVFWQGEALITGMAERAPRAQLVARPAVETSAVFLGLQDGAPVFAVDFSAAENPYEAIDAGDAEFTDMRAITGALQADDATILATARAMLHWQAQTRFCSVCGGRNAPQKAGYVMECSACHTEHFPRTDPAVIMLVAKADRLLLGQSHKFPKERNFYSTLAGFVEPGESLEDAVRREVFEEVGVQVGEVHYHSSQPWPFPASLMLGFYAEALTEEIVLDTVEMRDAGWFTREQINQRNSLGFDLPPQDSIARRLIDDWMEGASGT
jgi:NAD+ diphosphatase